MKFLILFIFVLTILSNLLNTSFTVFASDDLISKKDCDDNIQPKVDRIEFLSNNSSKISNEASCKDKKRNRDTALSDLTLLDTFFPKMYEDFGRKISNEIKEAKILARPNLWATDETTLSSACSFIDPSSKTTAVDSLLSDSEINCSDNDFKQNIKKYVRDISANEIDKDSFIDKITLQDGKIIKANSSNTHYSKSEAVFNNLNKNRHQNIMSYHENTSKTFAEALTTIINTKSGGLNIDKLNIEDLKLEELIGRDKPFTTDGKDTRKGSEISFKLLYRILTQNRWLYEATSDMYEDQLKVNTHLKNPLYADTIEINSNEIKSTAKEPTEEEINQRTFGKIKVWLRYLQKNPNLLENGELKKDKLLNHLKSNSSHYIEHRCNSIKKNINAFCALSNPKFKKSKSGAKFIRAWFAKKIKDREGTFQLEEYNKISLLLNNLIKCKYKDNDNNNEQEHADLLNRLSLLLDDGPTREDKDSLTKYFNLRQLETSTLDKIASGSLKIGETTGRSIDNTSSTNPINNFGSNTSNAINNNETSNNNKSSSITNSDQNNSTNNKKSSNNIPYQAPNNIPDQNNEQFFNPTQAPQKNQSSDVTSRNNKNQYNTQSGSQDTSKKSSSYTYSPENTNNPNNSDTNPTSKNSPEKKTNKELDDKKSPLPNQINDSNNTNDTKELENFSSNNNKSFANNNINNDSGYSNSNSNTNNPERFNNNINSKKSDEAILKEEKSNEILNSNEQKVLADTCLINSNVDSASLITIQNCFDKLPDTPAYIKLKNALKEGKMVSIKNHIFKIEGDKLIIINLKQKNGPIDTTKKDINKSNNNNISVNKTSTDDSSFSYKDFRKELDKVKELENKESDESNVSKKLENNLKK
ncbi:MAG: hypothetical protein HQK49_05455 [Oligoflexia bacterium]|nr:hypothetical protein [Oligoflexia bacterium]